MPIIPTAPLIFYPAYCFPLSPTFHTWARLTATDVYTLKECRGFEGQKLYFHLNHPIKWIRLVGLVVTFDVCPNRFIMILDDSSGCTIEIMCGRKPPSPESNVADTQAMEDKQDWSTRASVATSEPDTKGVTATGYDIDLHGVDIGSVVKVKGGMGEFRGQRQILLERISLVRTTTEEAAAWAENVAFRRDVLDRPWLVSEEEHTAVKRKAEGVGCEVRRKIKKRKASNNGRDQPGEAALVKPVQSGKNLRRRGDDERRWKQEREKERSGEQDRKRREEEVMKKIEQEDADRKRREEAMRKIMEEHENMRREEEEKKRKDVEERETWALASRQRNEARERVLREMGAGR